MSIIELRKLVAERLEVDEKDVKPEPPFTDDLGGGSDG